MLTYLASVALALLGLCLHWGKRWSRKQTKESFWGYLKVNPKHTFGSIVAVVGAANLILAGYAIDSTVNKGGDES
jgi:hypothetical protein